MKKKKKKKDKNIIEIDRKMWEFMSYRNKPCNHPLINNYTNKCANCGKDMNEVKKDNENNKRKME